MPEPNQDLTVEEVAAIVRFVIPATRRMLESGEIPGGYQIGGRNEWRVRRSIFEAWFEELPNKTKTV